MVVALATMERRIPRPSLRATRAEGEGSVSEQEDLILGQIRAYFDLPFSKNFAKFDENTLADKIVFMITAAIKNGSLPRFLNVWLHIDVGQLDPRRPGPLNREEIDSYLVVVGNYILKKKQDDFDYQVAQDELELAAMKKRFAQGAQ